MDPLTVSTGATAVASAGLDAQDVDWQTRYDDSLPESLRRDRRHPPARISSTRWVEENVDNVAPDRSLHSERRAQAVLDNWRSPSSSSVSSSAVSRAARHWRSKTLDRRQDREAHTISEAPTKRPPPTAANNVEVDPLASRLSGDADAVDGARTDDKAVGSTTEQPANVLDSSQNTTVHNFDTTDVVPSLGIHDALAAPNTHEVKKTDADKIPQWDPQHTVMVKLLAMLDPQYVANIDPIGDHADTGQDHSAEDRHFRVLKFSDSKQNSLLQCVIHGLLPSLSNASSPDLQPATMILHSASAFRPEHALFYTMHIEQPRLDLERFQTTMLNIPELANIKDDLQDHFNRHWTIVGNSNNVPYQRQNVRSFCSASQEDGARIISMCLPFVCLGPHEYRTEAISTYNALLSAIVRQLTRLGQRIGMISKTHPQRSTGTSIWPSQTLFEYLSPASDRRRDLKQMISYISTDSKQYLYVSQLWAVLINDEILITGSILPQSALLGRIEVPKGGPASVELFKSNSVPDMRIVGPEGGLSLVYRHDFKTFFDLAAYFSDITNDFAGTHKTTHKGNEVTADSWRSQVAQNDAPLIELEVFERDPDDNVLGGVDLLTSMDSVNRSNEGLADLILILPPEPRWRADQESKPPATASMDSVDRARMLDQLHFVGRQLLGLASNEHDLPATEDGRVSGTDQRAMALQKLEVTLTTWLDSTAASIMQRLDSDIPVWTSSLEFDDTCSGVSSIRSSSKGSHHSRLPDTYSGILRGVRYMLVLFTGAGLGSTNSALSAALVEAVSDLVQMLGDMIYPSARLWTSFLIAELHDLLLPLLARLGSMEDSKFSWQSVHIAGIVDVQKFIATCCLRCSSLIIECTAVIKTLHALYSMKVDGDGDMTVGEDLCITTRSLTVADSQDASYAEAHSRFTSLLAEIRVLKEGGHVSLKASTGFRRNIYEQAKDISKLFRFVLKTTKRARIAAKRQERPPMTASDLLVLLVERVCCLPVLNKTDIYRTYNLYVKDLDTHVLGGESNVKQLDQLRYLKHELLAFGKIVRDQYDALHNLQQIRFPPFRNREGLFQVSFPEEQSFGLLKRTLDRKDSDLDWLEKLDGKVEQLLADCKAQIDSTDDWRQNATVVFTVITIIFLPLSFVASVLGMNTSDVRNMAPGQWLFWAAALPFTLLVIMVTLWFVEVPPLKRWLTKLEDGS